LPAAAREPDLQRLVVKSGMLPSRDGDTSREVPSFGKHIDQLRCICGLDGGIFIWFVAVAEPESARVSGDGGCYVGTFVLGERVIDVGGHLRLDFVAVAAAGRHEVETG
jgi:hypothetical protein